MKNFVERHEKVHEYNGQMYSATELSKLPACTVPLEQLLHRLCFNWAPERAIDINIGKRFADD